MRFAVVVLLAFALEACAMLPQDGPSSHAVPRDAAHEGSLYALIDLDYAVTEEIAAHPPKPLATIASETSQVPNNVIAEGDTLAVVVIEASGGLFGESPQTSSPPQAAGGSLGGSTQQTLPGTIVDASGDLQIPFAGTVHVAGLTPHQAAEAIRKALRRRAVDPQVSVSVVSSNANSVSVIGEVRNTGRFLLSPHNDRLLDVLAAAGGPAKNPADLAVGVSRGARYGEIQLSELLADPAQNIRLAPHDQIRVLDRPRKYSTFGAFRGDAQTPIDDDNVTLAAAISRAGGLDTLSANAASVLVFRFERPEVAEALGVKLPPAAKGVPIVYRLNFLKPDRLFVADNFDIRPNDLVYVPRSDFSETRKFFDLVNSVTQIGYNLRVTSQIP